MMCLIGVVCPGCWGPPGDRPAPRPSPWASKPSLARTWSVHQSNWAWSKRPITDKVPAIIDPEYWSGAAGSSGLVGSGCPGPALGPAPKPLALVTNNFEPITVTVLGYQPVGIRPRTESRSVSMTAMSLSPQLATNSVLSLSESASPTGLAPTCAPGYRARAIVPSTVEVPVSITVTSSLSAAATHSRDPLLSNSSAAGWVPTRMSPTAANWPGETSRTRTVSAPCSATHARLPSRDTTTAPGAWPIPIVSDSPVLGSRAVTASARRSAASTRPSPVIARPAGNALIGAPSPDVSGNCNGTVSVRRPLPTLNVRILLFPPPETYRR